MTELMEGAGLEYRQPRRPIPAGIKPPKANERGYTVAEFAKHHRVAEITVRRWLADGMPSVQPGGFKGRHIIYLSQVRQWAHEFRCIGAAPGRTVVADTNTKPETNGDTEVTA